MVHMTKKAIVAVIGAMAGLGGTGAAHADAYAFASNQLTNFAITSTATFTVTGIPTRDTINTSEFSGFPDNNTQDPQTLGNMSNAVQATAGPGPFPAENTFTPAPFFVGTRGDSFTAAGSPFAPGGVPNVNNVAEGRAISGAGQVGGSSGRNVANANITVTGAGTFTFSFSDTILLMASTATIPGESAQSSIANTFSIFNAAGNPVFNFSPDGNLDAGETSDPFGLQRVCPSLAGFPPGGCNISQSGAFSATSAVLQPGDYLISLRTASQENLVTAVNPMPEPTSLLLVGAGIFGLGMVRRRKSA